MTIPQAPKFSLLHLAIQHFVTYVTLSHLCDNNIGFMYKSMSFRLYRASHAPFNSPCSIDLLVTVTPLIILRLDQAYKFVVSEFKFNIRSLLRVCLNIESQCSRENQVDSGSVKNKLRYSTE